MRFAGVSFVLVIVCAAVCPLFAQVSDSDVFARKQQEFKTAKNRWMLKPVDIRLQHDSATAAQRQLRDAFWDSQIGASVPLNEPQTTYRGIAPGGNLTTAPEFPRVPDGVWLVGKFEAYSTILSSSQRSIYTELHIRVQHVFGKRTPLTKGAVVDVTRPGGTIQAPWGGVVSYLVDNPRLYDAQPGHTYLLLLQHNVTGDFYTEVRRWELTSGIVAPDSELERYRAEHGKSEINGLELPDLIEYLDKKLANY